MVNSFGVDTDRIKQSAERTQNGVRTQHKSVSDDVQTASHSRLNVGDIAISADFQQAFYDWTQTRFEDLQATDDLLTKLGQNLAETAEHYHQLDESIASELAKILDEVGGGGR